MELFLPGILFAVARSGMRRGVRARSPGVSVAVVDSDGVEGGAAAAIHTVRWGLVASSFATSRGRGFRAPAAPLSPSRNCPRLVPPRGTQYPWAFPAFPPHIPLPPSPRSQTNRSGMLCLCSEGGQGEWVIRCVGVGGMARRVCRMDFVPGLAPALVSFVWPVLSLLDGLFPAHSSSIFSLLD